MPHDTAARPHELLKLMIKDVKIVRTSKGLQYAEISVNGKTGSRALPLIDSIPYIRNWLRVHPVSGNQNAPRVEYKLERLLSVKEREKHQQAIHMEDTQRLVTEEIEMLKVVLYLVSRSRRKPVNDG
jgi:hypothetical protein